MSPKIKTVGGYLVTLEKDGGPDAPYTVRVAGPNETKRYRHDTYREALADYGNECRRLKAELRL